MSNSKKKIYKKRKQAPHTKEKAPRSVPQKSKFSEFLDNWLWLITLVVIVALVALMVIFIPKCDESCASCSEGCSKNKVITSTDVDAADDEQEEAYVYHSPEEMRAQFPDVAQLQLPAEGEEIAVLETSMGTVRLRLFPEAAPKAVENFKGLINSGYYDGIVFHRVIDDFMIQAGDPGDGGKSIWGTEFEDELKVGLHNFRGALSMANSGPNTNGSQFFIVSSYSKMNQTADGLVAYGIDETSAKVYDTFSGAYWLDGELTPVSGAGHTTFGQVIDGMEIVDAIAAVATDENDKPYSDIVINKAYLTAYTSAQAN